MILVRTRWVFTFLSFVGLFVTLNLTFIRSLKLSNIAFEFVESSVD